MYRFYFYAQLAMDYPRVNPSDKQNCYLFEGFLEGLENEKTLALNRFTTSNNNDKYSRELEAIGEKISYYKGLDSKMGCDLFKQQELDRRALANEQASSLLAANVSSKALKEALAAPQSGGGTNIALYVGIGTAILIAGLVTYKVLSK